MQLRSFKNYILVALIGLVFLVNLCYADSIETQLSRDQIALGETVTVSFVLTTNTGDITPNFAVLEKDFRILGTNYGNSYSMVNGSTAAQTFWRLTLEPKKAGELIIPVIDFGGAKSEARKIMVDGNANHVASNVKDASVYVQADINISSPYVQSQVLYTFKLFFQSQLENPRLELPQTQDATFFQLGNDINYQTTIKGRPYNVVEKTFAFFPQKVGEIFIPATRLNAVVYETNASIDNPFYVATPKPVSLTTQAFTLFVRKIPDGFQGNTWLPAKNMTLAEKWSTEPNQWETGTPVTRTITVTAQGLRADQLPDLSIAKLDGVNVYTDTPKRSNYIQNNSIIGVLEQKVTYIPNTPQAINVPGIRLNWWNLHTSANAISELNPMTVHVKGKMVNAVPVNATPVAHLARPKLAISKGNANPFYSTIWFWIAIVLFAIWLFTLWLMWSKRGEKKVLVPQNNKNPASLKEIQFQQACQQGNSAMAQQFLLNWAKQNWQNPPVNLEKLCEKISDENFKMELKNLEQAMYAKKAQQWDGQALYAAFQQVKQKTKKKSFNKKMHKEDPLPALFPEK